MPKRKRAQPNKDAKEKEESSLDASSTDPVDDLTNKNMWLMKAEPESRIVKGKDVRFSISDLREIKKSQWDGVRNYEARNLMRDKMKLNDLVLFYHSNCKEPGVAGIARICREGYPDFTAWDSSHPYYDPKAPVISVSDMEADGESGAARWWMVDVEFVLEFERGLSLARLKQVSADSPNSPLKQMVLLTRGRLSIQPVSRQEFQFIIELALKDGCISNEQSLFILQQLT